MRISFQNPSPRKLISITSKLDFRSHYLTATWVWYIKENKNAEQKKNPDFNLRWITKILWRQLFQTHLIPNDIDNHFCWQDIEPWNSKMSQNFLSSIMSVPTWGTPFGRQAVSNTNTDGAIGQCWVRHCYGCHGCGTRVWSDGGITTLASANPQSSDGNGGLN